MCYSRFWIAAVVLLATVVFVSPVAAGEPQVAFVVRDGWVEFTLAQDDKPVPDAQVRVFTTNGHKFAEGETGPGGRGEFPLPPGHSFRVEIKIGDRTADPIMLMPIDDHVVPTNVLLSFGLAPCYRGTYTPSAKPGEYGDLLHGTFVIDRAARVVWANRGTGRSPRIGRC